MPLLGCPANVDAGRLQVQPDRRPSMIDLMKSIGPGAYLLEGFLTLGEQVTLANRCQQLLDDDQVGGYTPTVRGGRKMHLRMLSLGRHWNPLTYTYEDARGDFDGRPVPPLPDDVSSFARRAAAAATFDFHPDICLINWYTDQGRLGVHQDRDESQESLQAGWPVVSLSVGDTARFVFGGLRRRDPMETLFLQSGDAFVFGGPARLRYHGVTRILPNTAPPELAGRGRFNLTFRKF